MLRTLITVSALLLIATACSPTETPTPPPAGALPTQPSPAANTGASAAPATQPATQPAASAPAGGVQLQVLSPQDGAVVNTQQITVSGMASPGAVVTVNDDILIAGADGRFEDVVTLTDGINLLEVIASDASGNEASAELAVTYEP
jgi:hypothetical protein